MWVGPAFERAGSASRRNDEEVEVLDTTMTLPDGRFLGYTDLGAVSGPLVFYFHGAPSSRLDLAAFDDDFAIWTFVSSARSAGLRHLVTAARPPAGRLAC